MHKQIFFSFLFISFLITATEARVWHVAPEGTVRANGSRMFPWDIKTGLKDNRKKGGATRPSPVQPGDTIALHEGTYKVNVWAQLYGEENKPVVLMPYQNAKVIIDSNSGSKDYAIDYGIRLTGQYVIIKDLIFTNSSEGRTTDDPGNEGGQLFSKKGLFMYARESKIINCVFYNNLGSGILSANDAHNLEIYGCHFFYNGWEGPDRGHGHAMYLRNNNKDKPKVIEANVFHNSFGRQISGYGDIEGFIVKDNISFYAGLPSKHGAEGNVFFGGSGQSKTIDGLYITDNIIYAHEGRSFEIGYIEKHKKSVFIKNNYVIGGNGLVVKPGFEIAELSNNKTAVDDEIKIIHNRYEKGRATIAIMNSKGLDSRSIHLDELLEQGDNFEIIDVQNFFGEPVFSGTYEGEAIIVPLNLREIGQLQDATLPKLKHTPKEFNVFLVRKTLTSEAKASR